MTDQNTGVAPEDLFGAQINQRLTPAQQLAMDNCLAWAAVEERSRQAELDRQAEADRQQAARAESGHIKWTWDPATKSVVAK